MAKFFGVIGFADTAETIPGVWDGLTERVYGGDLLRNARGLQSAETLNDNVGIANEISIVADPYARQNFHAMRYITFMGARWKITHVEVQYPRLILTTGGVYNGGEPA